MDRCENCKAWVPTEEFDGKQYGDCRSKPPMAQVVPEGSEEGVIKPTVMTFWPSVASDQWCFQHEPIEEVDPHDQGQRAWLLGLTPGSWHRGVSVRILGVRVAVPTVKHGSDPDSHRVCFSVADEDGTTQLIALEDCALDLTGHYRILSDEEPD